MNTTAADHHAYAATQRAVTPDGGGRFELRYRSLFSAAGGFAFPCDAEGNVVLDDLSERALSNYLYARAVTGSELGWPSIERR